MLYLSLPGNTQQQKIFINIRNPLGQGILKHYWTRLRQDYRDLYHDFKNKCITPQNITKIVCQGFVGE